MSQSDDENVSKIAITEDSENIDEQNTENKYILKKVIKYPKEIVKQKL